MRFQNSRHEPVIHQQPAKLHVNFGPMFQQDYGHGEGYEQTLGITFENHLKIIEKDFWENRFPDYADWKDRWWRTYKKYGYFDTLTGFRCSGIMVKNDVTNYPAQGSAFHCLLWTLIQLDKVMTQQGWDSRIIGQIHDSCIIDVNPRELNHIVKVANRIATVDLPNHWKWIVVPMNVELEISSVDHSWAEKEGLN